VGRVSSATAPDPAPRVFSTSGLPDTRRVELWEAHNAAALIGLEVRAARPLEAAEVNVRLPAVQIARVTGSAHVVERTPAVISRSPADAVAVYLSVRGRSWFTDQEGTRILFPGSALVCHADRPFARGFGQGLSELVVKVPAQLCADLAGAEILASPTLASFGSARFGSAGLRGTSLASAGLRGAGLGDASVDPHARALARIAGGATRADRPVPADERAILDLVAVLAAGRRTASATAHRAAARCYVEDHLTDPRLSAGEIAAAIGISERQLSRVFAAGGTSVPRHILTRRLELARTLLTGPGPDPVADVAARCGFTSATYFSHVFRGHFGVRASELRFSAI
jgi:AraC-like DNA-binding protein